VPSYLVEVYLSRTRTHDAWALGGRVRAAARELGRDGVTVRYVRTTCLPDEETCFHLVEAASRADVEEVCRRARLTGARIVQAIEASRTRR
jgi:hypothetical protein